MGFHCLILLLNYFLLEPEVTQLTVFVVVAQTHTYSLVPSKVCRILERHSPKLKHRLFEQALPHSTPNYLEWIIVLKMLQKASTQQNAGEVQFSDSF